MKKFISFILTLCLAFGIVSFSVSAISTPVEEATNETSTAIEATSDAELEEKNVRKNYLSISSVQKTTLYNTSAITYNFIISALEEYDNIVITYASTQDINLTNYRSDTVAYTKAAQNLGISFSIASSAIQQAVPLNYFETEFEEIIINFSVISNGKAVQTKSQTIHVLPTAYGNYVSASGKRPVYEKYIKDALSNEIITAQEYKAAVKSISELPMSFEGDLMSSEKLDELTKTPADTTLMKYYDSSTSKMTVAAKSNLNLQTSAISQFSTGSAISIMSTDSIDGIRHPTRVIINRTITAVNDGDTLTIFGYVYWRDINGISQPAINITIDVFDEDVTSDELIATTYTNLSGYYTVTIDNDTGLFEWGYDIYIKASTRNQDFKIFDPDDTSTYYDSYYFTTHVTDDVESSQDIVSYASPMGTDDWRAFYIHTAMNVGFAYYKQISTQNMEYVEVKYDLSLEKSKAYGFCIEIARDDYLDFDVIIHELGHCVANKTNVAKGVGGTHSSGDNLLIADYEDEDTDPDYDKPHAIKLAWSEGWASYFSMVAQNYFNENVATISSIPGSADNIYMDFFFSNEFYQSAYPAINYETDRGIGEANEVTTTAFLLTLVTDMYKSDGVLDVYFTEKELWTLLLEIQATSLSEFVQALYEELPFQDRFTLGEYLNFHNVVDSPDIDRQSAVFSKSVPGTFYWEPSTIIKNYSSTYPYPTEFKLQIRNKSGILIYESDYIFSNSANYQFTLTASEWNQVVSGSINDIFYWNLVGYQFDPLLNTGPYYSISAKGVFSESITPIQELNKAYGAQFVENEERWFSFTAPIYAFYSFYSVGNVDAKADFFVGENFQEENKKGYSDDDGDGYNFLWRSAVYKNSRVYIRVTAYDNREVGEFKVACSKTTAVSKLDTAYSGELVEGVSNWYRFVVPETGYYEFYTTGELYTSGELFYFPRVDNDVTGWITYGGDDMSAGPNFRVHYIFQAGDVVYIRISSFWDGVSGDYDFYITTLE